MLENMIGDAPVHELDVVSFPRLSRLGRFLVGAVVDSWRQNGASITLGDAIRQVEETEKRVAARGNSSP
jgi:hypothetical protein